MPVLRCFMRTRRRAVLLADVLRLQPGEVQLQIAYVEGKWRSETAYDVVYQGS